MNTRRDVDNLSATLFGKARRAVLALLYGHSDEEFYLRQIARMTGLVIGSVQREVRQLARAGIIRRRRHGKQVFLQANQDCPVFAELKSLLTRTAGAGDALRAALAPLADKIRVAFIYGSVASGSEREASDIDVMLVGDVSFADVCSALSQAQNTLHREVNSVTYSPKEFRTKHASGHSFFRTVVQGPKVFIVGDEHELERLAKIRLAGRA